MKLRKMVAIPVAALLTALALAPAAPGVRHRQHPGTFRIEGAVEKPGEWTIARLEQELAGDIKSVSYTLKRDKEPEEKGEARCISLLDFIQAAKLHLNAKVKNHQLAFVALVRADDGYTAAFSMGELLPQFGKRGVWIALDREGKPLRGEDSPVQLLVPEDERPARWVHGVSSITLIDGFEVTNKKAGK